MRAEQVGSLLRPSALLQARVDFLAERLDRVGLRIEEDRAILEALRCQIDCGLDVLTDGEFRRADFASGFVEAVQGFVDAEPAASPWHRRGSRDGTREAAPRRRAPVVAGRLATRARIADVEARFLAEHAARPSKIALPSPLLFALMAYRPGVTDQAYPTRAELIADVAAILAEEASQLVAEGVRYIQIDAPVYTHWADPDLLARYEAMGIELAELFDDAVAGDNRILDAARTAGATTAVHLCRGNAMGRWFAEGGYDAIAERLFRRLRCDRLLLEFDSPRAGGFAPLRFVPAGKVAVLGLITTKTGELESRDELLRRIDAASRILPLEQLALSPQCGFASTPAGNPLMPEQQWRKLELVGSLAREVWP
jgi:5-methyltetrahydropteroyltriglutamate--homocysteine methyltransferase